MRLNVQLIFKVLVGDDGTQEADRHHSVGWGVTQSDGTGWGRTPSEAYNHFCCLYNTELQVVVTAPDHQTVHLPPVGRLRGGGSL